MTSEERTAVELSTEEQFSAALELSVSLYRKKAFEVRAWSHGIDIAVDDEALEEMIGDYDLTPQSYHEILDREVDVLLTAELLDISEEGLSQAPPLRGIDEDALAILSSRRDRVRALFPLQKFAAELNAKQKSVAGVLAGVNWEITHCSESPSDTAPVALLRFTSTVRELVSLPPYRSGDMPTMMLSLRPPDEQLFACTLSDVDYLIRRLNLVRQALSEAEEGDRDGRDRKSAIAGDA